MERPAGVRIHPRQSTVSPTDIFLRVHPPRFHMTDIWWLPLRGLACLTLSWFSDHLWRNTLIFCSIFSFSVSLQSARPDFKWLHPKFKKKKKFVWVIFESILKVALQIVHNFGLIWNVTNLWWVAISCHWKDSPPHIRLIRSSLYTILL